MSKINEELTKATTQFNGTIEQINEAKAILADVNEKINQLIAQANYYRGQVDLLQKLVNDEQNLPIGSDNQQQPQEVAE